MEGLISSMARVSDADALYKAIKNLKSSDLEEVGYSRFGRPAFSLLIMPQ
jgi:hypothetical protein